MAETINSPYKTEVIHRQSWKNREAVELATLAWVGTERIEHKKASVRAAVEHPFRVVKRQFGYVKVRYKGLAKNGAQFMTLFALANLWMLRKPLQAATG